MKSFLGPMDRPTIVCIALVALAMAASLNAQEVEVPAADPAENSDQTEVASVEAETCVPAELRTVTLEKLTPVYLSIDSTLGSKESTSGEKFPITVTEPVIVDGVEVIPIGTKGEGEVIHAKKAGGSGSGGELILTANFIDLGEQRIPLRSMELGVSGKDQMDLAMATGIFAGPVGFLVRGKNIDVAEGSLAGAKLAQDTQILLAGGDGAASGNCREGTDE